MTDKEFNHLTKGDLIEIIYKMKKTEEELRFELEAANAQLRDKTLNIKEAGSIADAVIRLNNIFEVAQKTADDYVERITEANANIEERCKKMERETILKCEQRVRETDIIIEEKWSLLKTKVQAYIRSNAGLLKTINNSKQTNNDNL